MTKKMESRGRRGRRVGRCHSSHNCNPPLPQCSKPWSFLSGFYSFLILSSLIGVIYMMLDYHCRTCSKSCDLSKITRNIDDIAKNLVLMKDNYFDLEQQITRFSHEMPKLEGQMEILEALANAIESKETSWDPKQYKLPNVDIFLKQLDLETAKNITKCKCPNLLSKCTVVNND